MMWKELTIIFIVIAVSYVFILSEKKYFDNQLMFIIAALLILVVYKSLHYINIINENKKLAGVISPTDSTESFTTDINLAKINEWLATTQSNVSGMTSDQQATLASDYNNLRQDLDSVKKLLQGLNAQQAAQDAQATAEPETSYDRPSMLNLASLQTIQAEKVDTLKKEINKAKALLNNSVYNQGKKDYPKITVHSSCLISDANGGYSSGNNTASTSNFTDTKAITAATNSTPSGNNAILAKAISGLLSGGVNINLSS
jgi:hypothetical protein